jgi:hypothetical protein
MRLNFKNVKDSPLRLMRRAGYGFVKTDEKTGEEEYKRRLSGSDFPRFHAFVGQDRDSVFINLHLDQKKPSYEGYTSHSGEYEDSEVLEKEAQAIKKIFEGPMV